MPTPEFILTLREKVGHDPLTLVGVTAVILRGGQVLLGRRADNAELSPVCGIVEHPEEPADTAVREVWEEAGVRVRVERLALVHQVPRVRYANGDECDFLDLVFRCRWVEGDPHPADGELTEVGWYDAAALPAEIRPDFRRRIEAAIGSDGAALFDGGR
jgi:8-oxo-dGTP pyrophosphatase MutT (NUDIX family)